MKEGNGHLAEGEAGQVARGEAPAPEVVDGVVHVAGDAGQAVRFVGVALETEIHQAFIQ